MVEELVLLFRSAAAGAGGRGTERFGAVANVGRVDEFEETLGVQLLFVAVEDEIRGAKCGLLLAIVGEKCELLGAVGTEVLLFR